MPIRTQLHRRAWPILIATLAVISLPLSMMAYVSHHYDTQWATVERSEPTHREGWRASVSPLLSSEARLLRSPSGDPPHAGSLMLLTESAPAVSWRCRMANVGCESAVTEAIVAWTPPLSSSASAALRDLRAPWQQALLGLALVGFLLWPELALTLMGRIAVAYLAWVLASWCLDVAVWQQSLTSWEWMGRALVFGLSGLVFVATAFWPIVVLRGMVRFLGCALPLLSWWWLSEGAWIWVAAAIAGALLAVVHPRAGVAFVAAHVMLLPYALPAYLAAIVATAAALAAAVLSERRFGRRVLPPSRSPQGRVPVASFLGGR